MSAERIKAARQLLGLSQGELAGAAGLSQGLISHLERGNRGATEATLRSIARGTGLPWAFFTKRPTAPGVDSLRFRKYRTVSPRDTARAQRTFIELFDVAHDLMAWARQPTSELPPRPEGNELGDDVIENVAVQVRVALGLDVAEPVRHLTRTLERNAVPVAPIVFTDLSKDEVDEVAAVGHFGLSGRLEADGRAVIAYFPSSGDRQRFTLAHELGHVVLHGNQPPGLAAEQEADRFAGALLFPGPAALELLNECSTLRDFAGLKAQWGVSIQALIMRAHHLGVIDDSRRTSLFKQISARGWRHNEPVVVRNEEPALLGTLVQRRFKGEAGVYRRAANDLGLPAIQLRSMMPPPQARSLSGSARQATIRELPNARSGP